MGALGRFARITYVVLTAVLAIVGWEQCSAVAAKPARIALLIGNQNYADAVGRLRNPLNDVALIRRALLKAGFADQNIRVVPNAKRVRILAERDRFAARVRDAGPGTISFFYYSGHGAANRTNKNYLIPVDVKKLAADGFWYRAVALSEIIESLNEQAPDARHFVIFDACRNTLKLRRKRSKALVQPKGFYPVRDVPGGMVIAYATAEGETASDKGAKAGPYATALARELVKPGVEAVDMFRHVQLAVFNAAGQRPWLSQSFMPATYLAGRVAKTAPEPASKPEPSGEVQHPPSSGNSPPTTDPANAKSDSAGEKYIRPGQNFTLSVGQSVELGVDRALLAVTHAYAPNGGTVTIYLEGQRKSLSTGKMMTLQNGRCKISVLKVTWRDASFQFRCSSPGHQRAEKSRDLQTQGTIVRSGEVFTLATGQSAELGRDRALLAVQHAYAPNGGTVRVLIEGSRKRLKTGQRLSFRTVDNRRCAVSVVRVTWKGATFRFQCR